MASFGPAGGSRDSRLAAKHLRLSGALPLTAAACLAACVLVAGLYLARLGFSEKGSARPGRALQQQEASAEDTAATLDEVDTVIFSRPPYSQQDTSELVYYSVAGIYLLCAIILLVGANLDQAERKRRIARSIVPHEMEPYQLCCFPMMGHKESVPCEITEQYYLDAQLMNLQTAAGIAERRARMNFWGYACRHATSYFEVLSREHLYISFLFRAIPTFTRVKRGFLIVVHISLCMATAAVALNIREHQAPQGRYEPLTCGDAASSQCFATVPTALIAAAVFCPAFRVAAFRQMRLTCFVSQSHPSSSRFPLGVRKFASLSSRSLCEAALCMRSSYERHRDRVAQSRSLVHRVVQMLWKTTRSSVSDLRFYSVFTSWCIALVMLGFVICTIVYLLEFTVYLKDAVVYHWLAWTLSMFLFSVLVLEPLLIFWIEVVWCAFVANLAQYWGFGSHALAATTKFKEVVRQVEDVYVSNMRGVASLRIQRWWLAVLDMYRAIHEQTAAAIKIQAIRKTMHQKKRYIKERKWCLKVEVLSCENLEQVTVGDAMLMSPFVRLMCDVGNPTELQTKIAWESGNSAHFNETFYIDIKESDAMYVSVWTKDLMSEEFIGRGYFDFSQLKGGDRDKPDGHNLKILLHAIQHGERLVGGGSHSTGELNLRVHFLDPLKDECGIEGQEDWMLPKNRMKFALSQMNPGRAKVGKMLGNLVPGSAGQGAAGAGKGTADTDLPPALADTVAGGSAGPGAPAEQQAFAGNGAGSGAGMGQGKSSSSSAVALPGSGNADDVPAEYAAMNSSRAGFFTAGQQDSAVPVLKRTRTGVQRAGAQHARAAGSGGGFAHGGAPARALPFGGPTPGGKPPGVPPPSAPAPASPPGQPPVGPSGLPAGPTPDATLLSLTPAGANQAPADGGSTQSSQSPQAPSMPGAVPE
mmetsp:Transcript_42939/g.136447  ORF Transcript_42939/g.136447 Transcript_42939/m.136447 type:complete len:925 (-) Transcript_42939:50-2824(-)